MRLRVLIPERHDDPVGIVSDALAAAGVVGKATPAQATLEDVFVAVTMGPEERAA